MDNIYNKNELYKYRHNFHLQLEKNDSRGDKRVQYDKQRTRKHLQL